MLKTTLGQLYVNEQLPESMRDYGRVMDKKGIADVFQQVADNHPEKYGDISHKLSNVGRESAYSTAGYTFGLRHMRPSKFASQVRTKIESDLSRIQARPDLDETAKEKALIASVSQHQKPLEKNIYDDALANHNPLALQVKSGARGNPTNLKSLLGGDLLYTDHHDNEIPVPVLNSYAQGLSPIEYWAGSFGARKGVADTKFATQDAGFFAKQLNQVTHRLIVTGDDDEPNGMEWRGLPVDTDDPHNEGAFLAHPAGGYPRNTALTPKILKDLTNRGNNQILVRSPMVGGPRVGGVSARDVGIRERGGLAPTGDFVGLAASQALSEKLTQGQLSSKHTGGVAGASGAVSGFKLVNQLVQVPKTFKTGATHSQYDGTVSSITDAPQGGRYVHVDGNEHYVPQDRLVTVKKGQTVEAGDTLSDGVPNPAEIVAHKHVGEGRRYFTKSFMQAYRDSGMSAHRRNVELLSRGLIDHVRINDETDAMPDAVPDDVVPYQHLEANWKPREGTERLPLNSAVGKYLETPILHHSIGTKIRPSMISELNKFGVSHVEVHRDPPPFEPVMIRGMSALAHDPDWQTRHLGSGLQKSTLEAVHRGRQSDEAGTSYVPAMSERIHFGRQGLTQGWKAKPVIGAPAPFGAR